MLYLLTFNLLLTLLFQVKTSFNPTPDSMVLGQASSNGTNICISPDQLMIAVGFTDGTLKIFDTNLNELCQGTSNNGSKILDLVWMPSFGPVTLDDFNEVTIWSDGCEVLNTLQFNEPAKGIEWNQIEDDNNTIGIIAINFGDRIEEYDVDTSQLVLIYELENNETCLQMVYNMEGDEDQQQAVLVVSTSSSTIRKFQTSNGTEIQSINPIDPVVLVDKISVHTGNVVLGMTENNNILRIDPDGSMLNRGQFPESIAIAICPTTKEFVLAHSTQSVGIYLYGGHIQQTLTSFANLPQDIECSSSYLVAVDQSGYVYIYTYEAFKSWIIAIIAGVLGGLLLIVIGIIVFIKMRAKWAEQANMSKYKGAKNTKYPKPKPKHKDNNNKQQSIQMLKVSTLQTTMRQ